MLVVQSVSSTDGLVLPVLTSIVVTAWVVVAVLLYREYRVNLLANLRGRTLHTADLAVEEESSLIAIDRLIGQWREVVQAAEAGAHIGTIPFKGALLTELHAAPGNPGIEAFAICHPLAPDDAEAVLGLARSLAVDLVVVGPEREGRLRVFDPVTRQVGFFGSVMTLLTALRMRFQASSAATL